MFDMLILYAHLKKENWCQVQSAFSKWCLLSFGLQNNRNYKVKSANFESLWLNGYLEQTNAEIHTYN